MKKTLLFSLMAVLLAGFWFGGVSSADVVESNCVGVELDAEGKISVNSEEAFVSALHCDSVREIDLASNIVISNGVESTNYGQELVINLNSYSITSNVRTGDDEGRHWYIELYGKVRIKGGDGSIIALRYLDVYGDLILDSGTIQGIDGEIENKENRGGAGVWLNYGSLTVNGGKIEGKGVYAVREEVNDEIMVTINGGEVTSNYYTFDNQGTLIVHGGILSSTYGDGNVVENSGIMTMDGGLIEGGDTGIFILGNGTDDSASLTISSGEIKDQISFGIAGNGSLNHPRMCEPDGNCGGTKITITDVTIDCTAHGNGCLAIYHPQKGVLNIAGGTFKGQDSAIEIRAGKLNISGGTFETVTDSVTYGHQGDGNSVHGAAIAVSQHTTYLPIEVNISDGTFVGNTTFIQVDPEYNAEKSTTKVETKITSGLFNGKVDFLRNENDSTENKKLTIGGGVFSLDATAYVDTGYTVLEKNSKFYVMSLADAATDESNTEKVQLPEGVTVNTGAGAETMDISDIESYLSGGTIGTNVTIEEEVLTGEIQDDGYQNVAVAGTVLLDFGGNAVFSRPIAIRIPVSGTNPVKVKVKHGTAAYGYTGLTLNPDATCNTDGSVASSAYTGTDITPVAGYAVIYTCSASTFVAYTETTAVPATTPSSSSSGGGGGGGSTSYSCKSLPANAVANNTSKPKKNTNYSYSIDTGAVCTFQCKSGYTWNEKDEKCEKSEETVADTDSQDTEKVESDATDTDNETSDTSSEDLKKVLDDGYTVEFHNAYDFAFKNGITTMPSIEEAHMNSPLTRIAMAKMLSQYAINVLGKKPANVVVPNFPDVSPELDAEYNNGVTLAYQLGIMGINIENFRPDDLVTRAEFATALSRLLYNTPDGEGAYYETHLKKLMEEKVITVADPDMHELRGYVMIMLMRSAKNN